MTISEIKSVKDKTDIVQVVGHFVKLKKDGANYTAPCPLHDERSASFSVSASKRIFKCFGCGKGGDVIDFVKAVKNISQFEAIRWIQEFSNIQPEPHYTYTPPPELPTSCIPFRMYERSMYSKKPNHFTEWLTKIFDQPTAHNLIEKYHIGTSKHWDGANIFWQFDVNDRIRSGKIMVYNPENGKRIKDPKPLITWVHKAARLNDFNVSVCLYGEHLIPSTSLPIAIVESEKTALVSSIIYPEFVWLASGSLSNLSYSRCKCLEGRDITLIPDVGAEQRWEEKRRQLAEIIPGTWNIRPLNGDHPKGYDLCDYILDNKI